MPKSKRMMRKHKVLSGTEFNEKYNDIQFVKLTNSCENHNNFHFSDGLNKDIHPFNPYGTCQSGGIYFIKKDNAHLWTFYNDAIGPMKYMRTVTIPDDARVYEEEDKYKTDMIILGPRKLINKEIYEKVCSMHNISIDELAETFGYNINEEEIELTT